MPSYNLVRLHISDDVRREFDWFPREVDIPILGKPEGLAAILTLGKFTVEIVKRENEK